MSKSKFCILAILIVSISANLTAVTGQTNTLQGHSNQPASDNQTMHGFDPANLDKTCKPCEDFYKFANGGWISRNPIPAAYPRWGNFNHLEEQNQEKLREILEESAKDVKAPKGSNIQKLGDFYSSGMDVEKIEAEGTKPLAEEFAKAFGCKAGDPMVRAESERCQIW